MGKNPKDLSPHYQANNKGGFGNPPVDKQFKGRPGPGRPRGGTTFKAGIQKLLSDPVSMTIDGEVVEVTMSEAILMRTKKEILKGSKLELGLELLRDFGPTEEDLKNDNIDLRDFSSDEKRIFSSLLHRAVAAERGARVHDPFIHNLVGHYAIYKRDDGHIGVKRLRKKGSPPLTGIHREGEPDEDADE